MIIPEPTPKVPPPIPAPPETPVAVTMPPLIVITEPLPSSPPPIPAPVSPPVAVTVPPLMLIFIAVPCLPPPIPAAFAPPVAVSAPVPLISRYPEVPFFCRPAQFLPLISLFTEPLARVIVTVPVLPSAILNAHASLVPETSMFIPARVIFAEMPLATSILSVVAAFGSVFFIISGVVPPLMVRTLPEYE